MTQAEKEEEGEKKVHVMMMILEVDLKCYSCYKKVKKLLWKYPQIRDQEFDVDKNKVTITVVCCNPEKFRDELCCKGGKAIHTIEIREPKKVEPGPPGPPGRDDPVDLPDLLVKTDPVDLPDLLVETDPLDLLDLPDLPDLLVETDPLLFQYVAKSAPKVVVEAHVTVMVDTDPLLFLFQYVAKSAPKVAAEAHVTMGMVDAYHPHQAHALSLMDTHTPETGPFVSLDVMII